MSDDIHVMPVGDLREHDDTAECWCRPSRDEEEPRVVIHNSMDGREAHEKGRPLQ
jgi:hypothetical protein